MNFALFFLVVSSRWMPNIYPPFCGSGGCQKLKRDGTELYGHVKGTGSIGSPFLFILVFNCIFLIHFFLALA